MKQRAGAGWWIWAAECSDWSVFFIQPQDSEEPQMCVLFFPLPFTPSPSLTDQCTNDRQWVWPRATDYKGIQSTDWLTDWLVFCTGLYTKTILCSILLSFLRPWSGTLRLPYSLLQAHVAFASGPHLQSSDNACFVQHRLWCPVGGGGGVCVFFFAPSLWPLPRSFWPLSFSPPWVYAIIIECVFDEIILDSIKPHL